MKSARFSNVSFMHGLAQAVATTKTSSKVGPFKDKEGSRHKV